MCNYSRLIFRLSYRLSRVPKKFFSSFYILQFFEWKQTRYEVHFHNLRVHIHMEGPREERVKSIFINFPFSLSSVALKCVLSSITNRIWKNELGPKI
jgi:hypothetical protein